MATLQQEILDEFGEYFGMWSRARKMCILLACLGSVGLLSSLLPAWHITQELGAWKNFLSSLAGEH